MFTRSSLPKNIKRNYFYILTSSFALTESIWMLYLAEKGMSLIQIGLLESIFHVTSLLMEVPTGMVADLYGRKTSRILGRAAACLATLLMLGASGFWSFVLAFILTAIGYNLESGAGDALVYDSLVDQNQTDAFMKIKGIQEICFQTARICALLLGGFVAHYSYPIAYGITALVYLISMLQAFYFDEPVAGRHSRTQRPAMSSHIKESLRVIWDHKTLLPYILYIEVFAFIYTTLYFYMQNALKAQGYTESIIGVVLAAASLLSVVTAARTYKLEAKLGPINLIYLGSGLGLSFIALMAFSAYPIIGFAGLALVDGLLYVTFSNYINALIPSSHRATLLSFQSMVFSSLMIICFPIFGAIIEYQGFKTAFMAMFGLACPIMLWTMLKMRQVLLQKETITEAKSLENEQKVL